MTVSTTDVLMYSSEDYELLRKILTDIDNEQSLKHHSGAPVHKSGLLIFIEHVLYIHDYSKEEEVNCWLNLSSRKMMYRAPLLRMPLCINSPKKLTRIIAAWRLQVNK